MLALTIGTRGARPRAAQVEMTIPDFDAIYRAWFHEVSRWVRAFGGLDCDLEDLTQEVFVVAQRKLLHFDGRNLPGWLYRIAQRTVRDHRRRAWFRSLWRRARTPPDAIASPTATPAERLEEHDTRRALNEILAGLTPKRRAAFILFEVEGLSGEEIARLEGVPLNTVWTRLRRARRDFLSGLERHRRGED